MRSYVRQVMVNFHKLDLSETVLKLTIHSSVIIFRNNLSHNKVKVDIIF